MAKAWDTHATFRLDREGKKPRSFDVRARRYADGAFVACVRAPSLCGDTTHRIELEPRAIVDTRAVMRATSNQLRTSLRTGVTPDSIGHLWDIVGAIDRAAPTTRPALQSGIAGCWDVVGFDLNSLRSELATRTAGFNPGALGSSAGTGALAGLATGGVEGAARGALNAIGGAMGMSPETAESIARGLAGAGPGEAEWQPRRDRALRELAQVIAAGNHPLGSDNWRGAVRYHVGNAGITPQEGEELMVNQSAIATFPRLTPYPYDRATGTWTGPGATPAASSPAGGRTNLGAMRAGLIESTPVLAPRQILADLSRPLTGVAGELASAAGTVPNGGAALGASELLARALAQLALESGSAQGARELAGAADVARAALRTVDAIAGARVGDPRARAAIRDAINAGSDRIARGLRVGLALAGG